MSELWGYRVPGRRAPGLLRMLPGMRPWGVCMWRLRLVWYRGLRRRPSLLCFWPERTLVLYSPDSPWPSWSRPRRADSQRIHELWLSGR